jgi:coenzyme F420-0:L-glutamate ligase/coenzyme F420-1:gamma-L-glutamate ligase
MSSQTNNRKEFLTFLRSRVSVRQFTPEPIPREILERILETAAWAPSAHNRQPWRFVVLESEVARQRLVDCMTPEYQVALQKQRMSPDEVETKMEKRARRILGAAVGVLLCYAASDMDTYENDPQRQSGEELLGAQSVALAGGQMMLAAHAEGMGSVWFAAPLFTQQAVCTAFELPDDWQPQALILMGYPAEKPEPRWRKPLQEVTRYF